MTIPKDLLKKIVRSKNSEELVSSLNEIKNRTLKKKRGKYYGKKGLARNRLTMAKRNLETAEYLISAICGTDYRKALIADICRIHEFAVEVVKSLLILISGHLRTYDEIKQEYIYECFVEPPAQKSIHGLMDRFRFETPDYTTLRDRIWDDAKFLDDIYLPINIRRRKEDDYWGNDTWLNEIANEIFHTESLEEQIYHSFVSQYLQKALQIYNAVESFFD